jgi:transcriptional regulator with XRE-family HTH domain
MRLKVRGKFAASNAGGLSFATKLTPRCHRTCETENMDWKKASRQLLRALRGRRSQTGFSRRAGYRSNVCCDWEAGRRFPTAERVLALCYLLRIDVSGAFTGFQPACASALGQGAQDIRVAAWLDALRGDTAASALAVRAGVSRYAVARWLSGGAAPRLPEFLLLVQAITGRASDLVAALVPIEEVRELLASHERRQSAKRLAFDAPWTEAVLRVMETDGYRKLARHRPGYVAGCLGIAAEVERDALDRLESAGVLQRQRGRYVDAEPLSVDTSAPAHDIQRLKAHWTRVSLKRLEAPLAQDWLGYNVISVSNADIERVREILRRAFREIRALAAASEPVQRAALLNLQLVTWPEPGEPPGSRAD